MAKVVIEGHKPDSTMEYAVDVTQATAILTNFSTITKLYLKDDTGSVSVVLSVPIELADAIAKAISEAH